jgi:hypothetical protein
MSTGFVASRGELTAIELLACAQIRERLALS